MIKTAIIYKILCTCTYTYVYVYVCIWIYSHTCVHTHTNGKKPMFMIGRLNIIKTSIPKAIYRFNAISIKIPMALFEETEKFILKFIWNLEGPQVAKIIL